MAKIETKRSLMSLSDYIEIVYSTFVNNKMRTLLTIFGVAVGIGAIIFLVSLGNGLQLLTIEKLTESESMLALTLTTGNSDILKIDQKLVEKAEKLSEIEYCGKSYTFSGQLLDKKQQTDATIYVVDQHFIRMENIDMIAGSIFDNPDSEYSLIISKQVSESLGYQDPNGILDQEISVDVYQNPDDLSTKTKIKLRVVGVSNESGLLAYLPESQIEIGKRQSLSIVKAKLVDSYQIHVAREKLEGLGFKVYSITEMINQIERIFGYLQYALFGFGLVALFVASMGMFNTLTISLLERMREVGIMKALGATKRTIFRLFLMEAIVMSVAGGILGIFIGWGVGELINSILNNMAIKMGGEAVDIFNTPFFFIVIIMVFILLIGILTGIYPARRAVKVSALDAIRYE